MVGGILCELPTRTMRRDGVLRQGATYGGDKPVSRGLWSSFPELHLGPFTAEGEVAIHSNDLANEVKTLRNRVLMDTPLPSAEGTSSFREALNAIKRDVALYYGRVERIGSRASAKRLIAKHGYGRYGRALESLFREPLSKLDGRVKMFLKAEKWLVPTPSHLKEARPIQYRDPRYNIVLGSYLFPVLDQVFAFLQRFPADRRGPGGAEPGTQLYTGAGLSLDERGRLFSELWDRFRCPKAYCLDFSRFDAHVSKELLSFEQELYCSRLSRTDAKACRRLMRCQLQVRGRGRWGSKYSRNGARVSGDLNTLGGNTVVSSIVLSAIARRAGLAGRVALVITGDDGVVIGEGMDVDRFAKEAEASTPWTGMVLEGELVSSLARVDFCSGHPFEYAPGRWSYIRAWPKPLYTDLWSASVVQGKARRRVTLAMSLSAWAQYMGQPVYYALALWMLSWSDPSSKALFDADQIRKLKDIGADELRRHREPVPTETARASFAESVGLSPREQVLLERAILGQVGPSPTVVSAGQVELLVGLASN